MAQEFDIGFRLLKECPEFQQRWDEHVNHMKSIGNPRTHDVDALIIAMVLDQSYISGKTSFFPRFFALIEHLLTEGEGARAAADAILELIWRSRVTRMNGPELYAAWMEPQTKQQWELTGKNVAAKYPRYAKTRTRKMPGPLREYKVTLTKCDPGERAVPLDYYETTGPGTATKFGGDPDWIQSDECPKCPCCNQNMTFVAQIDSIENKLMKSDEMQNQEHRRALRREIQWMFADVGMIYVFFCFDCLETQSIFQCH